MHWSHPPAAPVQSNEDCAGPVAASFSCCASQQLNCQDSNCDWLKLQALDSACVQLVRANSCCARAVHRANHLEYVLLLYFASQHKKALEEMQQLRLTFRTIISPREQEQLGLVTTRIVCAQEEV